MSEFTLNNSIKYQSSDKTIKKDLLPKGPNNELSNRPKAGPSGTELRPQASAVDTRCEARFPRLSASVNTHCGTRSALTTPVNIHKPPFKSTDIIPNLSQIEERLGTVPGSSQTAENVARSTHKVIAGKLYDLAQCSDEFTQFADSVFGKNIDHKVCIALQTQISKGDWSWLPEIRCEIIKESASRKEVGSLGFSTSVNAGKDEYFGKMLVNESLKGIKSANSAWEKVGDYIDSVLNPNGDNSGNQGNIFRRVLDGSLTL